MPKPSKPTNKSKFDRNVLRQALLRRQKESEERKDYKRSSVFKPDLEGVEFYKCGEGEHFIDIIPFVVGNNHPSLKPGDLAYMFEYQVHRGTSANTEENVLCLGTYGKKCPICEHRNAIRQEGADEEVWKALFPKRRVLYNVVSFDSDKEEQKGVQVWDVAHFYMEKHLITLMKGPIRPGQKGKASSEAYILFSDPDVGKSIAFTVEKPKSKDDFPKYVGHRFADRDYIVSDDILSEAHPLDELISIPTYEQVYEAYWGEKMSEKKPTRRLTKSKESVEEEAEETTEETEEKEEEEDVVEEQEEEEDVEEDNEEDESEDDEESDDEESDDDEDDDDKGKASLHTCLEGGKFGKDFDELQVCEECDEERWQNCKKKKNEMKPARKKKIKK